MGRGHRVPGGRSGLAAWCRSNGAPDPAASGTILPCFPPHLWRSDRACARTHSRTHTHTHTHIHTHAHTHARHTHTQTHTHTHTHAHAHTPAASPPQAGGTPVSCRCQAPPRPAHPAPHSSPASTQPAGRAAALVVKDITCSTIQLSGSSWHGARRHLGQNLLRHTHTKNHTHRCRQPTWMGVGSTNPWDTMKRCTRMGKGCRAWGSSTRAPSAPARAAACSGREGVLVWENVCM